MSGSFEVRKVKTFPAVIIRAYAMVEKAKDFPGGIEGFRAQLAAALSGDAREFLDLALQIIKDAMALGGDKERFAFLGAMLRENADLTTEVVDRGIAVLTAGLTAEDLKRAEIQLITGALPS